MALQLKDVLSEKRRKEVIQMNLQVAVKKKKKKVHAKQKYSSTYEQMKCLE